MNPDQYQVWKENESGDEHYVTAAQDGEVTTFCEEASRNMWIGPLEDFLKQFNFVRLVPNRWRQNHP